MAPRSRDLTDDEVVTIKANVEGLNVNQWSKRLGVSYRMIQKVVFRETHKDLGTLNPSWETLREPQRPGRKVEGVHTRPVEPSRLDDVEDTVLQAFAAFIDRLASRLEVGSTELRDFVMSRGRGGTRRRNKLNTREVVDIRVAVANGASYADVCERYVISRPTLIKVLGRGRNKRAYVPSDYDPTLAVGEDVDLNEVAGSEGSNLDGDDAAHSQEPDITPEVTDGADT